MRRLLGGRRRRRRDEEEWRLAAICRVEGILEGAPEKHAAGWWVTASSIHPSIHIHIHIHPYPPMIHLLRR